MFFFFSNSAVFLRKSSNLIGSFTDFYLTEFPHKQGAQRGVAGVTLAGYRNEGKI